MRTRIFISFDAASDRLVELAAETQQLGLGVAGRFTPPGSPFELVPDLRQQLRAADAVVVAFGNGPDREQVEREAEWSYEDAKGLVGVKLGAEAEVPTWLFNAGAEILDWDDAADRARLGGAIQAAVRGAKLMERARRAGTGSGAACARPTSRRPQ
jgi:hypothetical protein